MSCAFVRKLEDAKAEQYDTECKKDESTQLSCQHVQYFHGKTDRFFWSFVNAWAWAVGALGVFIEADQPQLGNREEQMVFGDRSAAAVAWVRE